MNGGNDAVAAETIPMSLLTRLPPVPPMKTRLPPGRIRPSALRATSRATGGDHHMVHRFRQTVEDFPQRRGVGGVERGGADGADLGRRLVEPVRIAAGENDACAF